MPDRNEWASRPIQSALLRVFIFLAPLGVGIAVTATLAGIFERPEGAAAIAWWVAIPLISVLSIIAAERVVRRLSPLAVLLKLSMAFPDAAPSRFAVARRSGNLKKLRRWVESARERGHEDDLTHSAEMILALAAALDAHHRLTRGHSERVGVFTDMLAAEMKLSKEARDRLRWAALLHDIGKLRVPAAILSKEGPLTQREWEIVHHHPNAGLDLAGPLVPWLGEWARTIGEHHERYDGLGYPEGLVGDEISLGARIIGVADAYEVMTTGRPYKKPVGANAARQEIAGNAGIQFDPKVVRALLSISLGKLWRRIGMMSWIAQLPLLGRVPRMAQELQVATESVAGAAKTAATVTAVGVGVASLPVVHMTEPPPSDSPAAVLAHVLSSSSYDAADVLPVQFRDGRPERAGKPEGTPGKGKAKGKGKNKEKGRPEGAGKPEGTPGRGPNKEKTKPERKEKTRPERKEKDKPDRKAESESTTEPESTTESESQGEPERS